MNEQKARKRKVSGFTLALYLVCVNCIYSRSNDWKRYVVGWEGKESSHQPEVFFMEKSMENLNILVLSNRWF